MYLSSFNPSWGEIYITKHNEKFWVFFDALLSPQ